MSEQPPPVPRLGEEPQVKSLLAPTLFTVLLHGLVALGVIFCLTAVVPKFRDIFASFGTTLPVVTTMVIAVSGAAKNCGALLPVVLAAFLAADGFIYYALRREAQPIWSRLWRIAVLLVAGAAVAGIVLALFLPLVTLMTQVGSSG